MQAATPGFYRPAHICPEKMRLHLKNHYNNQYIFHLIKLLNQN